VIPAHVDIGPHRYVIDSSPETGVLLHDEENCGDSRPDRCLVRVDASRPPTKVAKTLLHELIHCVWSHTPLRVAEFSGREEEIVSALAPWLLDMLRRNPDLVAYLLAASRPPPGTPGDSAE
jgi:hypothetical protein